MKKIFAILLMVTMLLSLAACGSTSNEPEIKPDSASSAVDSNTQAEADATPDTSVPSSSETSTEPSGDNSEPSDSGSRVLIAYFSATGTTKKIAEYAADAASADLYEIVPAEPYTADDLNYNVSNCRANAEMNDPSSRPEISGGVTNMADYDIVFIGYPIWWGEAPRIVSTFIESYDFSGKTVVTFSTSGGSGHNDRSIKELASGANWVTGARLKSNSSQSDVADWITGLGLDITVK
ncbi:MAG: flavodoxin [Christensenellaceae bacterium]|nr:flavodoxin [Christensenellaceae bacterium]PWM63084.1 MAG: flavodoxin [Clostridia bacterium]